MRKLTRILVPALLALGNGTAESARAGDLAAAWLRNGRIETRATSADAQVPLGSLWKLWVYAYAVQRGIETPPYRCATAPQPGEEYCCTPGAQVERDQALERSCGRFFDPARLAITAQAWHEYWERHTRAESAWLADLAALRPAQRVSIAQILHGLDAIPGLARTAAAQALLPLMLGGYGKDAFVELGASVRIKTFTWDHPSRPGSVLGGGAGWMVDGTPLWFAAAGASRRVLREHAATLHAWLPAPRPQSMGEACVVVDFFARYPLRTVDTWPAREPAPAGALNGRYRATFANGNTLLFSATGELWLDRSAAAPRIQGRLSLAEYVARVLDREADASVTEAARALAVVARTWLVDNATVRGGCYAVADSTRAQRVSPNPASSAAWEAALFTDGLVLRGEPVRYRLEGAQSGVLAWTDAVAQAGRGRRYDAILASAFERATLAALSGERDCARLTQAEHWLTAALPRWRRTLNGTHGFDPPAQPVTICALPYGDPYSDQSRLRIYVRELRTGQDRISLAHEYLHLAFRYHPLGADEAFIERNARLLAGAEPLDTPGTTP